MDLMELPQTQKGNKYVIVLQDYLTKWPLVYAVPNQKTQTVACMMIIIYLITLLHLFN